MCHDDQSRPPLPPMAGGSANTDELVLTSSDGARFAAFLASPDHPKGPKVIILPDVRGLHEFYKELALRFAEQGATTLAIDYFGRTAGLTARNDSFEYMPHVQQLQFTQIVGDVQAALAVLNGDAEEHDVYVVGFCMGGSLAYQLATQSLPLHGVVAFYGPLSRDLVNAGGTVLERAMQIRVPVLGLFGGADQAIPVDQVDTLDAELDRAGVEHEIVVYPGATHSFFDKRSDEFAAASSDAWTRILEFMRLQAVRS